MWSYSSHRWLSIALLLWRFHLCTANFTFTYSQATQCDDFEVSWQGGTGPFHLTLVHEFGTPRILTIPDSSFGNNDGTYKTTMVFPEGNRILAVMSDSSGFASGGVSPIITVGKQIGETQCNITDPGVAFYYDNDAGVSQCLPYKFYNYPDAVQPITIKGVVPGGTSFLLNPSDGAQTFEWTADVAAGTVVAMYMVDGQGRQGGVTDFMTVGISNFNQCLDSNAPSSVANAPSMTSTPTASTSTTDDSGLPTTSTTAPPASDATSRTNVAAIAGGVVGGVVVLALCGLLAWLCSRRRGRITAFGDRILGHSKPAKEKIDLAQDDADHRPHAVISHPEYVLHSDNPGPSTVDSAPAFVVQQPSSSSGLGSNDDTLWPEASPPPSTSARLPDRRGAPTTLSISTDASGARSGHSSTSRDLSVKSGGAGGKAAKSDVPSSPQRLTRVVLHTDLADVPPPPVEEEIIELPPQYTERAPLPASIAQAAAGVSRPPSSSGTSAQRLSTAEPER